MSDKKTLEIQTYQAREIEFTLMLVNDFLKADERDSCLKRRLYQSRKWMQNVLEEKSDTLVLR